jgi:hypothetical protein
LQQLARGRWMVDLVTDGGKQLFAVQH